MRDDKTTATNLWGKLDLDNRLQGKAVTMLLGTGVLPRTGQAATAASQLDSNKCNRSSQQLRLLILIRFVHESTERSHCANTRM